MINIDVLYILVFYISVCLCYLNSLFVLLVVFLLARMFLKPFPPSFTFVVTVVQGFFGLVNGHERFRFFDDIFMLKRTIHKRRTLRTARLFPKGSVTRQSVTQIFNVSLLFVTIRRQLSIGGKLMQRNVFVYNSAWNQPCFRAVVLNERPQ